MRKSKLTQKEIISLYVNELYSMQKIADLAGISKAAVQQHIKASGIKYRGGPVTKTCKHCQKAFQVPRKQVNRGDGLYCSQDCYHAARKIDPSIMLTDTERKKYSNRARKAMKLHVNDPRVVHHKDGNPANNAFDNLQLFNNQADHMRHHAEQRS